MLPEGRQSMKEKNTHPPLLFLGNAPHNLAKGPTWEDVISDLCRSYAPNIEFSTSDPFPLIFERLLLANPENSKREYDIKVEIAQRVEQLGATDTLREILAQPWSEILTTNYDFLIERTLEPGFEPKNAAGKKESKYSLYRHHKATKKRVWHLHGDAKAPNSILLGYDHYMGAVQIVREHIVTKYAGKKVPYKPMTAGYGWAEHFFAENHPTIVILGFGFNVFEYDLWWLLVYRARRIARNMVDRAGRVEYYYPSFLEKKLKRSLQMLSATGIVMRPVQAPKHNSEYYNKALQRIKREHFA